MLLCTQRAELLIFHLHSPAKGADEDSWEDSWLTKFPARHQEKILCDVVAIGLLGVFS